MNSQPNSGTNQSTFLGHPLGLYVLFFTEMWERFSYYGMRALLMLYMLNYLKWSQTDASTIYKWYTSLVYLTPLIGGYLADRYLGNKRCVIIGALLMAIGQFLLTFDELAFFYTALGFLIIGNGFFKPNMSTQVGRLYPRNDPRRDGAYTIFYMGINLGAFLSPLVCGWLAAYTLGKYHSGFAAAGIGMLVGMIIYVFGQRLVIELDQGAQPEPVTENKPKENAGAALTPAISETEAERTSSVVPFLNRITPAVLAAIGICLVISGPVLVLPAIGLISFNSLIAMEIAGVCALIAAWIASKVHSAVRDRVLTVYILGLFVVCFWAGFEQAGNVLNVWADQTTNRYLTQDALKPSLYPEVNEEVDQETRPEQGGLGRWLNMFKFKSGKSTPLQTESNAVSDNWWTKLWNPVSTEWFQSINALAIFLLAPIFAMMWTALERRRISPSIPTKMALGVVLMSVAFGFMVFAAKQEDRPTTAHLKASKLPDAIQVNEQNQLCHKRKDGKGLETPYHSGRLVFDPNTQLFHLRGVLPDVERDRIVRDTSPDDFVKKTEELQSKSNEAQGKVFRVEVQLNKEPPGFEMRYTGFNKTEVYYDPTTRTLSSTIRLKDRDVKALWLAAGDPEFRETINDLFQESSIYRVSPWWLFWFYIIATLGELCLSPVGLSMVSKLAPAKFATMLMGLWMLTSFFGNFAAGAAGELYGTVAPTPFFLGFVIFLASASLVLFLLVRKIVGMMHGVN